MASSEPLTYQNFQERSKKSERGTIVIHVLLVVISFAVSALIEYGVFSEKIADQERRISYLESQHYVPGVNVVTHDQFDEFRSDILRSLGRIEENQATAARKLADK